MVASDVVFASRALAVKRSDGGDVHEVLQTMSLNEGERGRGVTSSGDVVPPVTVAVAKRSKMREVASRYKSATVSSANAAAITAQRYQSPNRGRSPSPNFGRRSIDRAPPPDRRPTSAERRRPWPAAASENKTSTSNNLVDASKRSTSWSRKLSVQSLSSSIQSDTSNSSSSNDSSVEQQNHTGGISSNGQKEPSPTALENGKALDSSSKSLQGKTTPVRKRTPLRHSLQANEQTENSKPLISGQSAKADVRRWHGVGNGKTVMSRSMDFTFAKEGSSNKTSTSLLARSASRLDKASPNGCVLSRSANEGPKPKVVRRIYMNSTDDNLSTRDVHEEIGGRRRPLLRASSLDDNGSDTESSSSESLSIASFAGSVRPRAKVVPARFWQDATSMASIRQLKVSSSTRSLTPVRATHSGHSTPQCPLSPSSQARPMQALSPSRGLASPTRSRTGHPMLMSQLSLNGRRSNVSGLLSLTFETRKTKQTMGQQEEAHDLRLLHNRWLQWRFVNAQSELATSAQMASAESLLYECFLRTCDLRMSVATKQSERNKLRQQTKLDSVLAANAVQLKEWEALQSGHASTLVGLMEGLEATIVRVPLIGGPKIDIQTTKKILSSAIDIMNAVDASINKFLHRAEVADSLLSELAKILILEKAYLIECGDLLAAAALLETEERSLRAYFIQQNQEKLDSQEDAKSEGEH